MPASLSDPRAPGPCLLLHIFQSRSSLSTLSVVFHCFVTSLLSSSSSNRVSDLPISSRRRPNSGSPSNISQHPANTHPEQMRIQPVIFRFFPSLASAIPNNCFAVRIPPGSLKAHCSCFFGILTNRTRHYALLWAAQRSHSLFPPPIFISPRPPSLPPPGAVFSIPAASSVACPQNDLQMCRAARILERHNFVVSFCQSAPNTRARYHHINFLRARFH